MGVLFFILGACFGSFVGVCVYRMPLRESIVSPHSYCPKCKHPIPWYDNIPLISYLSLKGRCRFCGKKISPIYPGIELLTAGAFLATFLKFGVSMKLPIYLCLFLMLIIVSFIDAKIEIIPDIITIPGIILGIATSMFTIHPISSLLGVATGGAIITIFAVIGKLLFKKEAMGGGDIKLLAMIGSFTGWVGVLWVLFVGSIIGLIFGLIMRARRLPFAPFLSIATFIILISLATNLLLKM